MQATGGLDGKDGMGGPGLVSDEPVQLVQAGTQDRQRQWRHHRARLAGAQPDPVADLSRIDRDHQRRCRQRLVQEAHDSLPSSVETSYGRSRRDGVNGYKLKLNMLVRPGMGRWS